MQEDNVRDEEQEVVVLDVQRKILYEADGEQHGKPEEGDRKAPYTIEMKINETYQQEEECRSHDAIKHNQVGIGVVYDEMVLSVRCDCVPHNGRARIIVAEQARGRIAIASVHKVQSPSYQIVEISHKLVERIVLRHEE